LHFFSVSRVRIYPEERNKHDVQACGTKNSCGNFSCGGLGLDRARSGG
jgi:hypothetical protein